MILTRDNDYIRDLLLEFERSDEWFMVVALLVDATAQEEKKFAYCELLVEAGYLKCYENHAYRMTSKGHDFVQAIRSDEDWAKIKNFAASIGGGTLEILNDIAIGLLKQKIPETIGR